ncbi:MAG: hypothetical protein AAGA77_25525 [Bacteroidota bacterium]
MIDILIDENQAQLVDYLRTLTYRESKEVIMKFDFNNGNIFLEPLLFAYFNRAQSDREFSGTLLSEILQSHFIEKEALQLEGSYNSDNIAYIPNLGYFKKENGSIAKEDLLYVENTTIEILKYNIPLFRNALEIITSRFPGEKHFYIKHDYVVENLTTLNQAFDHIKRSIPEDFKSIERCIKKVVLFNEPNPTICSKATINAQGVLFINVFNNENNLAFFVDTIAHLSGYTMMTLMLQDKEAIFKINPRERIKHIIEKEDRRNFFSLFHRLYCNYAAYHCLHHYLNQSFCPEEIKQEVTQRMVFYLKKCKIDLDYFNLFAAHFGGKDQILTEKGVFLFDLVDTSFQEVEASRQSEIKALEDRSISDYRMEYVDFMGINK